MQKGLTFIELIIALMMMAIISITALPNWNRLVEHNQMRSLASELQTFFLMAKNEAVTRNNDLWVYFDTFNIEGRAYWRLTLLNPPTANDEAGSENTLLVSEGEDVFISANWQKIKVMGWNGKFTKSGHIMFGLNQVDKPSLKLIFHHITGRVRICSMDGDVYGYHAC